MARGRLRSRFLVRYVYGRGTVPPLVLETSARRRVSSPPPYRAPPDRCWGVHERTDAFLVYLGLCGYRARQPTPAHPKGSTPRFTRCLWIVSSSDRGDLGSSSFCEARSRYLLAAEGRFHLPCSDARRVACCPDRSGLGGPTFIGEPCFRSSL